MGRFTRIHGLQIVYHNDPLLFTIICWAVSGLQELRGFGWLWPRRTYFGQWTYIDHGNYLID